MQQALSFKNDCRLRLSMGYYDLKEISLAKRFLIFYFSQRIKKKLNSSFSNMYLKKYTHQLNYEMDAPIEFFLKRKKNKKPNK
jgi:hypothetical protein